MGFLKWLKELKAQGVPISRDWVSNAYSNGYSRRCSTYSLQKKLAETGLQIYLSISYSIHNDTQNGGVQIYNKRRRNEK
jgi:hypothetical protein